VLNCSFGLCPSSKYYKSYKVSEVGELDSASGSRFKGRQKTLLGLLVGLVSNEGPNR
jgi:hypothetical protein